MSDRIISFCWVSSCNFFGFWIKPHDSFKVSCYRFIKNMSIRLIITLFHIWNLDVVFLVLLLCRKLQGFATGGGFFAGAKVSRLKTDYFYCTYNNHSVIAFVHILYYYSVWYRDICNFSVGFLSRYVYRWGWGCSCCFFFYLSAWICYYGKAICAIVEKRVISSVITFRFCKFCKYYFNYLYCCERFCPRF